MVSFAAYLLRSSIYLTIFYIGYRFILQRETHFRLNRIYLTSSLLFSICLPFIQLTSPIRTMKMSESLVNMPLTEKTLASGLGWTEWLLIAYGVISLLLFFRLLYQLSRILKLYNLSRIEKRDGYRIAITDRVIQPFNFFRIVFINKLMHAMPEARRIISHEMIHASQWHSVDLLLAELITLFQWINPFVWPYKRALKETHEYLADEGVIAQGFNKTSYQKLIVEQFDECSPDILDSSRSRDDY